MESGKEVSVHIHLEGRPSILEMVSLMYSDKFVDKFIQNLQTQRSYINSMACRAIQQIKKVLE